MNYIAIIATFFAVANAQSLLDELNSQDNVIFTGFNPKSNTDFLQFAPADPNKQQTDSDGDLDTTLLVYTRRREVVEYWGLAASYEAKKIWASNVKRATLLEFDLDSGDVTTVSRDLTSGLENIAYDRITKVLYWTDSIKSVIRAMDTTYRHFTNICTFKEVSPYAIAIHPVKRKMFYSSYKLENNFISKSEIVKCDLDCTNCRAILKFPDVIRPRGLTIDFSDDRLFWTDQDFSGKAVVVASDLDGRVSRQFFSKSRSYLWGIAHYKKYIYVTDIVNTTADQYQIHIRNSNGRGGLTKTLTGRPRNVAIYGPDETASTKVSNECDNSKCEQLCLASSSTSSVCKCSPGFNLVSGYKCESRSLTDEYLLITDVGQKRVFQLPIRTFASSVGNLIAIDLEDQTKRRINAAAVDKSSGELVWYDLENSQMVWGNKRLTVSDVAVNIAVDCCGEKIYWSTLKDIFSWDGKSSTADTLYSLSFFSNAQLRQLTVDCKAKFVYWIEYDSLLQQAKVKRSDLKGRDEEVVLSNIPNSFAITIDYQTSALYVLTALEGLMYTLPLKDLRRIRSTSVTRYQTTNLKTGIADDTILLTSISVVNGWVYLGDDANDVIRRFSISRGTTSMENYGNNEVFYQTAMDFYSKSYYRQYLRPICKPGLPITTTVAATTTTMTDTTTTGVRGRPIGGGGSQGGGTKVNCIDLFRQATSGGVDFNTAFAQLMTCLMAQG